MTQFVPGFSEIDVLLLCARTTLMVEQRAQLAYHLAPPISWSRLAELAASHSLMPLLHYHLSEEFAEIVSKSLLDRMQSHFVANVRNNMLMVKELRELLQLFAVSGIRVVPYKGLVLAHLAYPDRDLRVMDDIDLFVHERDLERITSVLLSSGYDLEMRGDGTRAYRRYSYHYSFRRVRSGRLVEVHWRFVRDRQILTPDAQWPWANLRPVQIDRLATETFSPEDWIILLSAHGAKHWWRHLANVCDLAEWIRKYDMDWEYVEAQAKRLGAQRMVNLGLLVAYELLQAPIPEYIIQQAQANRVTQKLAAAVCTAIHAQGSTYERFSGIDGVLCGMQLRERLSDKLSWAFQQIALYEPNENDLSLVRLPTGIAFLYRWIRLGRLLITYGSEMVRLVLGRH